MKRLLCSLALFALLLAPCAPLYADGDAPILAGTISFETPKTLVEGMVGTCAPDSSSMVQMKITSGESDLTTGIEGAEFTVENREHGDYARLEVVDVDGIAYPAGTVLADFGKKIYMPATGEFRIRKHYSREVPAGMYYRVTYYATAAGTTRNFVCNLFLVER